MLTPDRARQVINRVAGDGILVTKLTNAEKRHVYDVMERHGLLTMREAMERIARGEVIGMEAAP